jgi:hypothetical protein
MKEVQPALNSLYSLTNWLGRNRIKESIFTANKKNICYNATDHRREFASIQYYFNLTTQRPVKTGYSCISCTQNLNYSQTESLIEENEAKMNSKLVAVLALLLVGFIITGGMSRVLYLILYLVTKVDKAETWLATGTNTGTNTGRGECWVQGIMYTSPTRNDSVPISFNNLVY